MKFIGLLIYNNVLVRHIVISPTVFETQGFEKCQKNIPTPYFEETLPRLRCLGETRFPLSRRQIFRKYFDPCQDVFGTPSP